MRSFAKNPNLKDSSQILQPFEEVALLDTVSSKVKGDREPKGNEAKERGASSQFVHSADVVSEVPLMQKFQISADIDEYKKLAFKRTSVSTFVKANAYKRNKAMTSSNTTLEKDLGSGGDLGVNDGKQPKLMKPENFTKLKNEIVGAVVASAAGVNFADGTGGAGH